ncbi:MAG: hypothetical protein J6Q59_04525 [Paludibacteraceae bacterium]|nr:hypothetical protein [Paludibacteraceae bacterium]
MSRTELVYICSPCRGKTAAETIDNITKAREYCAKAAEFDPEVIPFAPHVYFTQWLNDNVPAQRAAGMEMGLAMLEKCSELWVYGGFGNLTEGMAAEVEYARQKKIKIRDMETGALIRCYAESVDCIFWPDDESKRCHLMLENAAIKDFKKAFVEFAEVIKRNAADKVTEPEAEE